ncbi:MAG: GerMN domain-containing protein [Candidatus Doudnabacteria bacterium]|nr:GerMN domain-containing protein [Candidatus Doudnabacteria bacterium]
MKKALITILLLIAGAAIVLAGLSYYSSKKTDQNDNNNQNNPPTSQEPHAPSADDLRLATPKPNDIVSSPLEIAGEVCCGWYFEAQFPVRIEDQNGNMLGQTAATAIGDWMTSDYVPFQATLEFNQGNATAGFLVLSKDNASGLPENDFSVKIPVRFESAPTTRLKVFFANSQMDPEMQDCTKVYAVNRTIPKTLTPARASLEELLRGPTVAEKQLGYITSINSGVKIQKLTIENGVAKVDFDKQLETGIGGSCRVANIRAQITETLKQFATVSEVIISIDGRTEDILQP